MASDALLGANLLLVANARHITKPTTVYERTPGPALQACLSLRKKVAPDQALSQLAAQGDVLTLHRNKLVGFDWSLEGRSGAVQPCTLKSSSTFSSAWSITVAGQQLSFSKIGLLSSKRTFAFGGCSYVWRVENHLTHHLCAFPVCACTSPDRH